MMFTGALKLEDVGDFVLFAAVVRAGSLAAAARLLEIPKSTISRHLARLEARVGQRLLARTTRKIVLTDAGAAFLEYSERVESSADDARRFLASVGDIPRGRLRVTMPGEVANYLLADPIAAFIDKYPEVKLEIDFSARRVDLVGERFDIAIRVGPLPDSTLVAKRFVTLETALFASPKYLASAAPIDSPAELSQHRFLMLGATAAAQSQLELFGRNRTASVTVAGPAVTNSLGFLRALVISGAGIGVVPAVMCQHLERSGGLVRVLPGWKPRPMDSHYVLPSKYAPVSVRRFVDMLDQVASTVS